MKRKKKKKKYINPIAIKLRTLGHNIIALKNKYNRKLNRKEIENGN